MKNENLIQRFPYSVKRKNNCITSLADLLARVACIAILFVSFPLMALNAVPDKFWEWIDSVSNELQVIGVVVFSLVIFLWTRSRKR